MQTTTATQTPGVSLEELLQMLTVFGVENCRSILKETATDIRQIVSSKLNLAQDHSADDLHKACGRLSLFGVYAPRYMSRELRSAMEEDRMAEITYQSRVQMLETVQLAEEELNTLLDEYAIALKAPASRPSALSNLFTLCVASYGGAAVGFAATFSIMAAFSGLCLGTLVWLTSVLLLNAE